LLPLDGDAQGAINRKPVNGELDRRRS